ncbi:DinB family protein [Paenisporosarcina sp. TG-14]|uniref:DinB family protein n=1 Tax=Paenisporosarcina sp. TG-14 TaxID=1231057 RepID=UPI00030045A3|nr:DinB family protein [Paenisporosarcina sp. TG-14]
MNKQQIIEIHKKYQVWLNSLKELSNDEAMSPYAPGKWSPNVIIMHLAQWDRFTFEDRLPLMKEGAKLEKFPAFEEFNAKAAALASQQTFEETIAYAKEQRQRITKKLEEINDSEWHKEFNIGNHSLSIMSYFTDFSEHDEHHKRQIERVRSR